MTQEKETLVGALDFGSHSIKLAVGKYSPRQKAESGAGWHPDIQLIYIDEEHSRGAILRGVIRNLIDTAELVRRLLARAEETLGGQIRHVAISISGESVQSYQCEAETQFEELHEVTKSDLLALTEQIEPIPNKYFFGTANYAQYYVNGVETLRPVGVRGHNVRAVIQFFICDEFLVEQIQDVLELKLGLTIIDFFAGPTLLGDSFLTYEQKRIGSALIDFGAETTTLALYKNGLPILLRVLPIGSKQITDDLTYLSISPEEAERLKCHEGTVILDLKEKRLIRVKRADMRGEQEVQYYRVNQFMEARTHEILDNLKAMTEQTLGDARLPGGIVLVGGGSQLRGLDTLLSETFGAGVDYAYNRILNNPEGGLLTSPAQLAVYSLLQKLQNSEPALQRLQEILSDATVVPSSRKGEQEHSSQHIESSNTLPPESLMDETEGLFSSEELKELEIPEEQRKKTEKTQRTQKKSKEKVGFFKKAKDGFLKAISHVLPFDEEENSGYLSEQEKDVAGEELQNETLNRTTEQDKEEQGGAGQ